MHETGAMDQADNAWVGSLVAELRRDVAVVAPTLVSLSHEIHAQPELRFEEHQASASICALLVANGFAVSPNLGGMKTAFRAERSFGQGGGPTIAVFCEYDALEGIGHACGHNIIAAAGAGAAIAASRWLEAKATFEGRVVVLGSPGEEGGGGKIQLINAGVLDGIDAAVMVHPAGYNAVDRPNLCRASLEVSFSGRASHAAAAPEGGRNALDASTLFLVALGLLRQQLRSDSRLHAIVLEGGVAVNVIPEHTRVKVFIRSPDLDYLRGRLYSAVSDCADGAALATGTTAKLAEVAPAYDSMFSNAVLADIAAKAFTAVGRDVEEAEPAPASSAGSTDMGNVSRVLPAIHPYICVEPGLEIHTREFEQSAGKAAGDQAVIDGAAVLATTMVGLFCRPALLQDAQAAFTGSSQKRVYSGSEAAGVQQRSGDVVGEVPEAEGGAA